jgi:hypothetical protein
MAYLSYPVLVTVDVGLVGLVRVELETTAGEL